MVYKVTLLVIGAFLASSCDFNSQSDYNAKADFDTFKQELQAKEDLVAQNGASQDPALAAMEKAKKSYSIYCASCHGAQGAADSAVAKSMNPRPRALVDAKWQNSVDDAHIAKVIKEGGPSVGLSPTMAPWGATLSDMDIQGLVKLIRNLGK